MMQKTEHRYIVTDDQILGGEPIIVGTRTPVRAIAEMWRQGVLPEDTPRQLPHLTLAQVFDALSYYSDHQGEINGYIERNRIPDELIHTTCEGFVKRLFIELYLDEDVSVLVADLLRSHGFAAVTTREAGQLGKGDEAQLAYAVSQSLTMFTHNRADFEALAKEYFASERKHCGIILATRRSPYDLVRRLLTIINNVTADEMEDQVIYI